MAKTQWCRDHIDQIKANCGDVSEKTVNDNKKASKFCVDHPAFTDCPTQVVCSVLAIKNSNVKNNVIQEAESILKRRMPNGGFYKAKFTGKEIGAMIAKYQVVEATKAKSKPIKKPKPVKIQNPKSRILMFDILEKDDLQILRSLISLDYAENEYEANRVAIKWAAERIADGMK